MEINEKVRERLIENLETSRERVNETYDYSIRMISESDDVEEIMERKRYLLKLYIAKMPFGTKNCYFCLNQALKSGSFNAEEISCDGCEYKTLHGRCIEEGSDYQHITIARSNLAESLSRYYYAGEEYDQSDMQA